MKKTMDLFIILILAAISLSACGGGGGGDSPVPEAQPTRAQVFIAFDQSVPNLAGLDFKLSNTAGAVFDDDAQQVVAVNNAADGSLVAAKFDAAANSTRIVLANQLSGGINTGTAPFIKIIYAITADAGKPAFNIDLASAGTFSAYGSDLQPITSVTGSNLVVTVTYDTGS